MFKILISLFLIAGSAVIFFTKSKDYFSDVEILRKQASSYNETINTAKEVKNFVDEVLSAYNSVSQENVDRINKMISSGPGSMELVVQIDEMMKKNGLDLDSIDTKEIAAEDSVLGAPRSGDVSTQLLSISIKARGPYESFHSFMQELERSLRLIDVNSVKISSAGQDDYLFSIEAVSYWQKTGGKT